MKPEDFIFNQVYKGALADKCSERASKDCAVLAMEDFRKCRFKKAKDLIDKYIKQAKKL